MTRETTDIALQQLWPNGAPRAVGHGEPHEPALSVHLPARATATGCGIVICPGGGYRVLASDHEGLQVALALNRLGIAAFVLRYRVGPTYSTDVSLADGQRAVRWVRHRAPRYGLRTLGMLGFSAGGHLTLAVGTHAAGGDPNARDAVDRESAALDFMVAGYAVTNGPVRGRKADEYTPTDTRVDEATPPTFLMHTHQDSTVSPEQSILFYRALLAAGVPAELHIYGVGEHGVGLGHGDPNTAEWFAALHRWLRQGGFLTNEERTAVTGQVTIDGRAPGLAWLILEPDDPNAPVASVKFDGRADGGFVIDAKHGPVPGSHWAVVHHLSDRHPYTATGAFTLEDVRSYETRVEIVAGAELVLQLEVRHRTSR